MNTGLLVAGIGITCWGFVEFVWAVLDDELPRHMVAQGFFFVELGLGFVVMASMPLGIVRTTLAMTLFAAALWTGVIQYRMMRAARREQQGQEARSST